MLRHRSGEHKDKDFSGKTRHGSKGKARRLIIIYRTVNKRTVCSEESYVLGPIFLHIPMVCHADRDNRGPNLLLTYLFLDHYNSDLHFLVGYYLS